MTDIDFYILAAQQPEDRLQFACRLVEKAYRSNCEICVHFDDAQQAQGFDDLLWSFRAESFIPHAVISDDMPDCSVYLSHGSQLPPCYDVLINLAEQIPSSFTRYNRVLEVVIQHDDVLLSTRKHYKFYKDRGYPMNNFDMRIS